MPVFAPTRGRSAFTSCSQSFSASGSLVKVLLQDQLSGHGIDCLVLHAAQPAFGLDRGEALVASRDRQAEAALELAREALDAARERMLARLAHRQADDQPDGLPLRHQAFDLIDFRDRRQGMRGAQLGFTDCNSNTLEAEIEGE